MSILQLGPVIFEETDQLIHYLRISVLPTNKVCPLWIYNARSYVTDGVLFRCPDCHKCTTIRDGSFFSEISSLNPQKVGVLVGKKLPCQ